LTKCAWVGLLGVAPETKKMQHLVRFDARLEFLPSVILSQIPPKPKLLSAGHEFAVNFAARGSIGF
jgi:hypothetical protein